jgi:hypothetical protein
MAAEPYCPFRTILRGAQSRQSNRAGLYAPGKLPGVVAEMTCEDLIEVMAALDAGAPWKRNRFQFSAEIVVK